MGGEIRTFIALELSDEVRVELSRIIKELKVSRADVKWVKPESVHITLKFLGSISEDKVTVIAERLSDIAKHLKPFDLKLNEIGVFPKWDHPRVLWVAIGEGSDSAVALADKVEGSLKNEGFEKEKRSFSPHLTIGRIKSQKNKEKLKEIASSITVTPVSIYISRIILFQSDLTPEGSIYTRLAVADLTK